MDTSNPVLSGLIRKRQEVAGELEAAYGRISALTVALSNLDGAIRLFAPETALEEIAPRQVRYAAQPGEISRKIREALRDAEQPLTVRDITIHVMAARHMNPEDRGAFLMMQKRVMASLRNMQLSGAVQSHREPGSHLRWALSETG